MPLPRVTPTPHTRTTRDVRDRLSRPLGALRRPCEVSMPNDRLRDAMLKKGLTPTAVAEHIKVDPKTVERWITQDRSPYPRHRHAIAALLREGESYLWPNALSTERASE